MINEQQIYNRMAGLYQDGNSIALWGTLSVPDNKTSRKAIISIDASAPSVAARVSDWKSWIANKFPDFLDKLAEIETRKQIERENLNAQYARQALESLAKNGKAWNCDGVYYHHALAMVQGLTAKGYTITELGKGLVRFDNVERDCFIGPFRNKNINAAVKFNQALAA